MNIIHLLLSVFILLPASGAFADVPPEQRQEVEHLLQFVAENACQMQRNGKWHTGEEAAKHIHKKYEHFRDQISSTEEFIDYAASRSTVSHREYMVTCQEAEPVTTREWLLQELEQFRSARE